MDHLAFGGPANAWPSVVDLAPRAVMLFACEPEARILEIEVRAIPAGDELARVMLLATDVTEQRRLLDEARARGEEHEGARRAGARVGRGHRQGGAAPHRGS